MPDSIAQRAFPRKAALYLACTKTVVFPHFSTQPDFLLLIFRAGLIISIRLAAAPALRGASITPLSGAPCRPGAARPPILKEVFPLYEQRFFSRAAAGRQALDAGFYHHHARQRDLDAGQFDVRLCPEPSCARLHA